MILSVTAQIAIISTSAIFYFLRHVFLNIESIQRAQASFTWHDVYVLKKKTNKDATFEYQVEVSIPRHGAKSILYT